MNLDNENNSKTIMIVDDDESVLSFLTFSLKTEGFQILSAKDAEKGLEMLKSKIPDLILMDIMLPKMDGFSMCKVIKKNPQYQKVPVIFITAYGDPSSLEKTKEADAQGLIEKPIMFDELLLQVLDGLNGRFSLPTRLKFQSE